MDEITLIRPTIGYADRIAEYRAEFPSDRMRVTYDPDRIPGLDYLEQYENVTDWLRFCDSMAGKISWYMSVRASDGKVIGFACLRHRLEYDDDDDEFASHIGYSVRPSEQGKGYGREQLRLMLMKAKELGLVRVRLATEVLRKEGFGLSWIHYTHLEHWYSRLGYRTVLHWNRNGIL